MRAFYCGHVYHRRCGGRGSNLASQMLGEGRQCPHYHMSECDMDIVMEQTDCEETEAIASLVAHEGDIELAVAAIRRAQHNHV